ncbi:MAG: D-alanine--D-alanine ligase [Gemmatimonadaceae bacterium]|nr:D-alanine--D-alanine ligase [Gemmatimonadaceae bacterium]
MRKLRVLLLTDPRCIPPENIESLSEAEAMAYRTEWDVIRTLRKIGHEVQPLGVYDELRPIRLAIDEFRPDIVFNLLEEFASNTLMGYNVAGFLELMGVPYTGCNPRGLILTGEKSLAKKVLIYHRIRLPAFHVAPLGRRVRRPRALGFPLIVKSLTEHASLGISQASLVHDDQELSERVAFIHRRLGTDALVEQFIVGRELYVGVLGNDRLVSLPPRELVFEKAPADTPVIATARAKHNLEYQQRHGIEQRAADELPPDVATRIGHLSKRIYRTLGLTGYARVDYRLGPDGQLWFLEANPNPELAEGEEFASAAQQHGIDYPELLQRIVGLGLRGTGSREA